MFAILKNESSSICVINKFTAITQRGKRNNKKESFKSCHHCDKRVHVNPQNNNKN